MFSGGGHVTRRHAAHDTVVTRWVTTLGGRMLLLFFASIQLIRRPRPIHARGAVLTGRITWLNRRSRSGISWVDVPQTTPVTLTARLSRSVGVPAPLPDVVGLSLRIPTPDGPADLELASTGFRGVSRFWLAPQRSPSRARFTTLLPYRTDSGPVLLAARTISPTDLPASTDAARVALLGTSWWLRLYHARPLGKWHPFAELELVADPATEDDEHLRFDAVRHPLPGAQTYAWTARLREPAYRRVQRRES